MSLCALYLLASTLSQQISFHFLLKIKPLERRHNDRACAVNTIPKFAFEVKSLNENTVRP